MILADYKNKIMVTLRKMTQLQSEILDVNVSYVNRYLSARPLLNIERILHSLKTDVTLEAVPSQLISLTKCYMAKEEVRLKEELEKIHYDAHSVATLTRITGPGRIERVRLISCDIWLLC
jgi:hypothetical protein